MNGNIMSWAKLTRKLAHQPCLFLVVGDDLQPSPGKNTRKGLKNTLFEVSPTAYRTRYA
jgi:hypothetical protein